MLNKLKLLFIGDIVGKPARECLKEVLPSFKKEKGIDFVIANGENASGGSSIVPKNAEEILEAGVDVITTGDHIFKKKEAKKTLDDFPVIRVFMQPVDCPFKAIRDILPQLQKETKIIIVDMHAEATSEKLAMGYFLAKSVSAVIGTHTHIPTADERILENFTGYITDVGMTGSFDSILGREKYPIIEKFITNIPKRFDIAKDDIRMQAVLLEIDSFSGGCENVERIEIKRRYNENRVHL
ncbi:MAG: hypothetical protein B6D56_03300 [Candidatus Omnitrophica bacterium 4484_70.1]|nr:MAG: hypothetical protein B6D56_03300 [Candidatus Omnitrophica bacterium 4484_70.1]